MTGNASSTPEPEVRAPADLRPRGVSRADWRRVIGWARAGDLALEGLSLSLMVAVAIGFGTYVGRRVIVGEVAEEYLRRRGVEAEIAVIDVDARGFIGRVRLGPAGDPDFAAERVEVLLDAPPPPEGPYALRPRSILIRRPQLKALWTGERLSFGVLDPLIEEALSRPPRDDRAGPRVTVQDGALRLFTPYGLVRAAGGAVVDDSRLQNLDLILRPAALEGPRFAAELAGGRAQARAVGGALDLDVSLALAEVVTGTAELADAAMRLSGRAPYPDFDGWGVNGPVRLNLGLRAAGAETGTAALQDAELNLSVDGALAGPVGRATYAGDMGAALRAESLTAAGARVRSVRADARLTDAALRLVDGALQGRGGARLTAAAGGAELGANRIDAPRLTLASSALNFDTAGARASGPLRFDLFAARLTAGDASVRTLRAEGTSAAALLRRDGDELRLTGPMRARARAAAAELQGQGRAEALDAALASDLRLLTGAAAPVQGALQAERLRLAAADPLTITDVAARFRGRAGAGGVDLTADLRTDAALPRATAARVAAGLPLVGGSPAYAAAIGRALSGFTLSAPEVRLTRTAGRTRLMLAQPVQARAPGGALAVLAPSGGPLVLGPGGVQSGGVRLAFSGGGLPAAEAVIGGLQLGPGRVGADVSLRAALDIPLAEGAVVEARGRASTRNGAFTFTAADCVTLRAARVELGENDVEAVASQLCPLPGVPAVQTTAGGYRIRGRFAAAAATAPFLQARLSAGEGVLDASGDAVGLTRVDIRIATAEAADTAPERRFHPLAIAGTAALDGGVWRATLDILDAPAGTRVATAALTHQVASGEGGVDLAADDLRFTPDGLQPIDLSPVAAGLVAKADGAVDFTGRVSWTPGAPPAGTGRAVIHGFDFESAFGPVVGLSGEIDFDSLTPLLAPPGQVLTAERIEAFLPLTEMRAEFQLLEDAVQLGRATFGLAGGRATLEPLLLAFEEPRRLSSAVRLDAVDLGSLVAASSFADKVALQAVVDGRIPFDIGPGGMRFAGGELRSVRPGRLSIDREALTQVSATGGSEAVAGGEGAPSAPPPPNAFQDWAYQALENLAYSELEVEVDSRPEGRLGLVFTVKGRHDPPTEQQARIGLFDLLRGRAFQKEIPLPSDTPVNLTLDTSLNFDELLATYLELQRERSAPVQSAPATVAP